MTTPDPGPVLSTARLTLRPWGDQDAPAFAALNANRRVARYLPGPLTPTASAALLARLRAHFATHGYGLWAVLVNPDPTPVGFVGLQHATFAAPFTPCVEVGWRLHPAVWGHGVATEAARRALTYGFECAGLAEIVSFTVPANQASRRVMEKLGMLRDATGDFEHPLLPAGHPLRAHVLYRLPRSAWQPVA